MIRFENLTKVFALEGKRKVVAKDVNVTFPTGRSVALLGRNGAGKSTLLKMIAGTTQPSSGRIVSTGTISWPVGFAGSFHPELSGAQNCGFIGRIYGVDTDELIEFVRDFAERHERVRQVFPRVRRGDAEARSRVVHWCGRRPDHHHGEFPVKR